MVDNELCDEMLSVLADEIAGAVVLALIAVADTVVMEVN